jgi:hypothetical protein
MISRKLIFFFFSVFGCIPKNAPENILRCLVRRKKIKIKKINKKINQEKASYKGLFDRCFLIFYFNTQSFYPKTEKKNILIIITW